VPIGPKNIVIHELIGLEVVVIHHSDPTMIGLRGKVVDETMKTLVIDGKRVPKEGALFCFRLPDDRWTPVKGEEILLRPWERTKKGYKRYLRRRPQVFESVDECVQRYIEFTRE